MLPNATPQAIEQEIWRTLGSTLHVAMRGKTANFRYFRNLTRTALPLLFTTESASSRWVWLMDYLTSDINGFLLTEYCAGF